MGENRKVYRHAVTLLCRHAHECTHMLLVVDTDVHIHRCMHIALRGSDFLVLKPKCYRRAHKSLLVGRKRSGGEGRRGNQTREHLRRKRYAVVLVLLSPSSVK